MNDNKVCQSCGMTLTQEHDYGLNADGTINHDFCQYCFTNGVFSDEGLTLDGVIYKSIKHAHESGASMAEASKKANKLIPKLKRWASKIA